MQSNVMPNQANQSQNIITQPSNNELINNYTDESSTKKTPNQVSGLKKPLIINGIAVAVIVIIIIIVNLLGGSSQTGLTAEQGETVKISNKNTKMNLKVESVIRNTNQEEFGGEIKKYTKIKISAVNTGNDKIRSAQNLFSIYDANGQLINVCFDVAFIQYYIKNSNDAIDMDIPAGESRTGYIYCEDPTNAAKKLKLASIVDAKLADNGNIQAKSDDIFINLKQ